MRNLFETHFALQKNRVNHHINVFIFLFFFIHSGYYICLGLVSPRLRLFDPARAGLSANICLLACLSIALGGAVCARYWSWNKW